jgi:dTDP-4-dehydrorhamnose 3,5-epimerase
MAGFQINPLTIPGLMVVEPTVFGDGRGYFMETYNDKAFAEGGIDAVFVQDNQSMSKKGVLRGLHFQYKHPQGKLVRVLLGEVFDVAVDLRPDSPTLGRWAGVRLSSDNKKQFYVPPGFAHGFLVLSDEAVFSYKCTEYYHPEDEGGIAWDDPSVRVQWPLCGKRPVLSQKDRQWGSLEDAVDRLKAGGKRS